VVKRSVIRRHHLPVRSVLVLLRPAANSPSLTGLLAWRDPEEAEYLRFRSDPILLKQIAERTGGRLLTEADVDLFHPARIARESSRPVFDWILFALCCLVPLDVGIRRVQLDRDVLLGWFRSRKAEASGETMGALLQRKQLVKEQIDEQRAERPPPIIPASRKPASTTPPKLPSTPSPKPEQPKTEEDGIPQSTTERLLARKRKRQEDQP